MEDIRDFSIREGEPETRIKDFDEAMAMAQAGHDSETLAARYKQLSELQSDAAKKFKVIDDGQDFHFSFNSETHRYSDYLDRMKDLAMDIGKKSIQIKKPLISDEELATINLEKEAGEYLPGYYVEDHRGAIDLAEDAIWLDGNYKREKKEAEKYEKVAQAMHHHPEIEVGGSPVEKVRIILDVLKNKKSLERIVESCESMTSELEESDKNIKRQPSQDSLSVGITGNPLWDESGRRLDVVSQIGLLFQSLDVGSEVSEKADEVWELFKVMKASYLDWRGSTMQMQTYYLLSCIKDISNEAISNIDKKYGPILEEFDVVAK